MTALTSGTRLGPYEILSPLGAGGMGEVYRARDSKLGREVAINVLPEPLASNPEALSRFEREARAVAALSHPNILAIHDFGSAGGVTYAVMELLEGETLGQAFSEGAVPLRKATEWALQIAHGLAAAHGKGIVHRDLKPDNVFVTKDGPSRAPAPPSVSEATSTAASSRRSPTPSASVSRGGSPRCRRTRTFTS
jgi:serine/threonine protein kinase